MYPEERHRRSMEEQRAQEIREENRERFATDVLPAQPPAPKRPTPSLAEHYSMRAAQKEAMLKEDEGWAMKERLTQPEHNP